MIFFGHLGPTAAAFKIYEKASKKKTIDYRFVLVGAILPDLIDKPIGLLFKNIFHNSRLFAHTLLFSAVLILIGIYRIRRKKKNDILTLGISTSIHLVLDSMQLYPATLFWPAFGFTFPERYDKNWAESAIHRLFTDPTYYVTEILGFIIIMYLFLGLVKRHQIKKFIRTGKF